MLHAPEEGQQLSEAEKAAWWRYTTLVDAGYSEPSAARLALARYVDLHDAVDLVTNVLKRGKDPELAERILL